MNTVKKAMHSIAGLFVIATDQMQPYLWSAGYNLLDIEDVPDTSSHRGLKMIYAMEWLPGYK